MVKIILLDNIPQTDICAINEQNGINRISRCLNKQLLSSLLHKDTDSINCRKKLDMVRSEVFKILFNFCVK